MRDGPPAGSIPPASTSSVVATSQPPATPALGPQLDTLVAGSLFEASERSLLLALSNAAPINDITRFLYNGLYRLDASLAPVPDLAAEPCAIANGGLTITCRLRPARFHDGSPVTAEDVVESYRIALSPVCAFEGAEGCLMTSVDEVVALDDRTVELRLNRPDPTVLTLLLPGVFIYSKRQIEADAAPFLAAAPGLDAAAYAAAADEIEAAAEAGASDPAGVCGPAVDRAEELLAAAGLGADWEPYFAPIEPDGPPDLCFLARYLGRCRAACGGRVARARGRRPDRPHLPAARAQSPADRDGGLEARRGRCRRVP